MNLLNVKSVRELSWVMVEREALYIKLFSGYTWYTSHNNLHKKKTFNIYISHN